jgi:hypothetical protein
LVDRLAHKPVFIREMELSLIAVFLPKWRAWIARSTVAATVHLGFAGLPRLRVWGCGLARLTANSSPTALFAAAQTLCHRDPAG